MIIRHSKNTDHPAISRIHQSAFGEEEGPEIVELVLALMQDPTAEPMLSLVAEDGEKLLGHILFTAVKLLPEQDVSAVILAPLAVLPGSQNTSIGGNLIKEGLKRLKKSSVELVFVLGYPAYYSRFGFQTAGTSGFEATYPVPTEHADAWMVIELTRGVIDSAEGKVQCAKTLDQAKYWQE